MSRSRRIFSWNSLTLLLLCIIIIVSLWIGFQRKAAQDNIFLKAFRGLSTGSPCFLSSTKPKLLILMWSRCRDRVHRSSSEFCRQTKAHLLKNKEIYITIWLLNVSRISSLVRYYYLRHRVHKSYQFQHHEETLANCNNQRFLQQGSASEFPLPVHLLKDLEMPL